MELAIPHPVAWALERLRRADFRAVLVGGCVRDLLRGVPPRDWDIAASAFPKELKDLFAGEKLIETGLRYGTLTLFFEQMSIEITSFRADGIYSDGRRPDQVCFTRSLEEDLARRDFTINALCLDEGEALIDLFDGRGDLLRGLIRCIGEAQRRFEEDALRILRALRFAATFGFLIEEQTAQALRDALPRLRLLAAERVLVELERLLCAPDCGRVLLEYPEVLCALLPPLGEAMGLTQPGQARGSDAYAYAVRAMCAAPPVFSARLVLLLHDITAGETGRCVQASLDRLLAELHCSTALRERVLRLTRLYSFPLSSERLCLRQMLAQYGEETLWELIEIQRATAQARMPAQDASTRLVALDGVVDALSALLAEHPALSLRQLAVRGGDLMALGVPCGRELGVLLKRLLEEVIAERLPNEREALLGAVRSWLAQRETVCR